MASIISTVHLRYKNITDFDEDDVPDQSHPFHVSKNKTKYH